VGIELSEFNSKSNVVIELAEGIIAELKKARKMKGAVA